MTEQQKFYQSLYENETLFELWVNKLNPNEELWIGSLNPETGLNTKIKSVKVKDATNDELKIYWAQHCSKAAMDSIND